MATAHFECVVKLIEAKGVLLVYPLDNRPEPESIWSELYPRTPMRWEWDESGDDRVAKLWRLREELSSSGRVVYLKWFRGRATFFARDLFVALLSVLKTTRLARGELGRDARNILSTLEMDSPLSTKELKRATDLRGKASERVYERGMKELWLRGLIVGYGERGDGAFPSLLVGAASVLFEDLWVEARALAAGEGYRILTQRLSVDSLFLKQVNQAVAGKAITGR